MCPGARVVDQEGEIDGYFERFDDWRRLASEARAMLNIAAQLHTGNRGRPNDWGALRLHWPRDVTPAPTDPTHHARAKASAKERLTLGGYLDTWLQWGLTRHAFDWRNGDPWTRERDDAATTEAPTTSQGSVMSKRRRHGEGSVHQRGDGRWAGTVELGWQDGRRRRKTVYGSTRREAADKMRKVLQDRDHGLPVTDERREVGDFLDAWLRQVVRPTVRPRTYESYEMVVRVHLSPAFGKVKLNRLGANHVQGLIADKLDAGLSPRTVEYLWQVLRRALKVAMTWGLVSRNVAELASPPRPRHTEVVPMTVDEMKVVLAAARSHRLEAAFSMALSCGLRRGEILALRWSDLVLDATPPQLRVAGSLQRVNGALSVDDPKSAKSRRTIAVPHITVDALRRQRVRQAEERLLAGDEWHANDLVFTTPLGTPVDPRNFLRQWHRLLDDAGVPRRALHEARHAAASLMLSEGVPLKVVQEVLGHSTFQLTADRYGHLMPQDGSRAAEAVERALSA